ncbi:MAG TPA: AbrB/MazE/SpoVT family DNA-binding domain-containing protein [Terracidiphilus sp.]|nr:AbrB/MazE/SpoVT family DNA-binding domain-containing protein [Terracidiphilus sp.]
MPTATMTSKGQITIPVQIRKALGLKPGVRVDFCEIEDGEYVLRPKTGSIMEMRGCLAYTGPTITIEEVHDAVLDRAAALDRATLSDALEKQPDGEAA